MSHWSDNAIFYHIYPLGCCGAPFANEHGKATEVRLAGLKEWIPYLKDLGVNALFLGPLFASDTHGYDTIDYYFVDRRLGANETLADLVRTYHDHGFKIIVDGVFNHTSRHFWAFRDIVRNGQTSPYVGWYAKIDFSGRSPSGDPFSYDCWEGHYNLPRLNLENGDVVRHLFGAVKKWITEFGIDGLRLDAAYHLNHAFLRQLKTYCRSLNPDFWLMGEVIHGDYTIWANPGMLDSTTNYETYKGLYSSHNDRNFFEISYSLNRQYGNSGIYKNLMLYNFADNHDVERISSRLADVNHLTTLYALLFTIPGIPSIYYGSETGIEGVKNHDDSGLRPRLSAEKINGLARDNPLHEWIKTLIAARKSHPALQTGSYRQLYVSHLQFIFSRSRADEEIVVILNADSAESRVRCMCHGRYIELTGPHRTFFFDHPQSELTLAPYSAMLLKRV
ncbi:MAG: hypothetical protein JW881_15645 [Spirochaetales bacterium]|nr:hypothetical protein [Spirochaetales bacterium]